MLPKGGSFVPCQVDPELRTKLSRPALPANDLPATRVYAGRMSDVVDRSEDRTASAVNALDNCNAVNTMVQSRLSAKPWWNLWARD